MKVLPFVPSVPFYRVATSLAGAQYVFDVHWNSREGSWYFDLLTVDETMIRAGIKIVLGAYLGGRSAAAAFPAGVFLASDQSGEGREAGFDDLGERVIVAFIPQDELEGLV